jgi:hypothetical protein
MLKRNWALIALVYLALAEALSLAPVPDLSLCLIQPEHSQQAADHNEPKYCPAFHTGLAVFFERTDHFLEAHDKSVIGGFTIVLAISTIGLWLATNKLWAAGEKQLEVLSESAAAQSRDMQAAIAIAERSADAARDAAKAAMRAVSSDRAWISWDDTLVVRGSIIDGKKAGGVTLASKWRNTGRSPALNVRVYVNHTLTEFGSRIPIPSFTADFGAEIEYDGGALGPGNHIFTTQRFVSESDYRRLQNREILVWLYSRVEYEDIFNPSVTRHSETCECIEFNGEMTVDGRTVPNVGVRPAGSQNTAS